MLEQESRGELDAGKNYEDKIKDLEALVRQLEGGGVSLEESMRLFEEGTHLLAECKQMLSGAERRMEVLLADLGEIKVYIEDDLDEIEAPDDDGGLVE